jgi:hypothetical protein
MVGYTLADGTASTQGAVGAVGPYMRKVPSNQFVAAAVANVVTPVTTTPTTGDGTSGWVYNSVTGEIKANSLSTTWPDHIDY